MWSFLKRVFNFRSKSKREYVLEKADKCDSKIAIGSAADQISDQENSNQGYPKLRVFQPRFDLVDFSSVGSSRF